MRHVDLIRADVLDQIKRIESVFEDEKALIDLARLPERSFKRRRYYLKQIEAALGHLHEERRCLVGGTMRDSALRRVFRGPLFDEPAVER